MVVCPKCGQTIYSSDTPENVLLNHNREVHLRAEAVPPQQAPTTLEEAIKKAREKA